MLKAHSQMSTSSAQRSSCSCAFADASVRRTTCEMVVMAAAGARLDRPGAGVASSRGRAGHFGGSWRAGGAQRVICCPICFGR
jgi:hypothetical protein